MNSSGSQDISATIGIEGQLVRPGRRIRVAAVGCGSHAFRNVLPLLRFLPEADLVACCDLNLKKAAAYAHAFGAQRSYADHRAMLDAEHLDAVLLVLGFDDDTGRPLYPEVAGDFLQQGIPVWLEKPPAADAEGVRSMLDAADRGGTFAQVGFKKVYSPAVQAIRQHLRSPYFKQISSYSYRYGVDLPPLVGDLRSPSGRRFLDDFVHVASVIVDLFGAPAMTRAFHSTSGDGVVLNLHPGGTLGTVLLTGQASGLSPIERFEIVGRQANLVLDNGVDLVVYPPGDRGPYGRSTSYIPAGPASDDPPPGPQRWLPEFSLGNLHGGTHFLQGYYQQLRAFVDAVVDGRPPEHADLHDAQRVMTYLDALAQLQDGWVSVDGATAVDLRRQPDEQQPPVCTRTGTPFVMKDGWNYVCRTCGRTTTAREQPDPLCPLAPPPGDRGDA